LRSTPIFLIQILLEIIIKLISKGKLTVFTLKENRPITKLQKAMGHSSINVSLTYLRGLELPELKEEDVPMV
jgi:hypothetical protein|tara:strand:- start:113 stop:328 length:216 start_codon:yes stop_codon:yes gene_type:complete